VLLITTLLLASCFVINHDLFNGLITAKHLWVQMVALTVCVWLAIKMLILKSISFKPIDFIVLLLMVWMISSEYFSLMPYANFQDNSLQLFLYCGIYVFFRFLGNKPELQKYIITIYLFIVTIESIYGLMQLYGVAYSNHGLFNITGHFHNPGPFSGFVVSGLPMALGLYFETRRREKEIKSYQLSLISNQSEAKYDKLTVISFLCSLFKWIKDHNNKTLNYFAQFVIVVLLLVLPAARSRAAWLGGIIGCLYILYYNKETLCSSALTSWCSVLQKRYIIPVITLILLFSLLGLYKFKQGSADGRLLMWQVSCEMIKDKPFTGWGQGGFEANYANYQAEWFKSGRGTPQQEMVAGVPGAPFNELIRVGINYGLIAVILIVILLFILFINNFKFLFKNQKNKIKALNIQTETIILRASLLSIIIFSQFSYSFDVAPIIVTLIILLALLVNKLEYRLTVVNNKYFSFLRLTCSVIFLFAVYNGARQSEQQYKGLKCWKEAYELYQYCIYSDAAEEYRKANTYFPCNGQLKQMYGKCLAMDEQWDGALIVLEDAKQLRSNPILYNTLGNVYQKQKDYQGAEKAYKQASFVEPYKFYPQYLLAKMYNESGQYRKAKMTAKSLLGKEVKVSSSAIKEMNTELKRLFEK
jgi:O-antigen ligase